jgi:H+/Cl- antiporter ClcA
VVFGLVGVALPLTMFSGSDQLKTVLKDAGNLGLGLLVAILIAKMLTFAVSQGSGFVGGPIFPSLFIGGTAGVLVHQVFPGVPLGLAFSCLLAAVPGSVAPASLSMVLLAAFLTQVGALQTAPILIAVITAFLTMEGVKYLVSIRKQSRARPRRTNQPRRTGPAPKDDGPDVPPHHGQLRSTRCTICASQHISVLVARPHALLPRTRRWTTRPVTRLSNP